MGNDSVIRALLVLYFTMMRRIVLFALLSILAACTSVSSDGDALMQFGPFTATGTISATGASLYRRGTHLLSIAGHPRFFLESKTVRLNDFEEMHVVVEGELSPNTHPRLLPVIQVMSAKNVGASTQEQMERYTATILGLSLDAPLRWKSAMADNRLTFTLPMEEQPFIAIEESLMPDLPEGIPVRIGSRNGIRSVENGVHRVYVSLDDQSAILFTFGPKGDESAMLRDAFYTMLKSVVFDVSAQQSSSSSPIVGSRQPCGGPAAVLCPPGEYCEVREIDTGIGVCRAL